MPSMVMTTSMKLASASIQTVVLKFSNELLIHIAVICTFFCSSSISLAVPIRTKSGPHDSGQVFVRCQFAEIKTSCLIDTGSTDTVMKVDVPTGKILKNDSATFVSVGGTLKTATKIEVSSFHVGNLRLQPATFSFIANEVGRPNILGMDILNRVSFSLEFSDTNRPELNFVPLWPTKKTLPLKILNSGLMELPVIFPHEKAQGIFDTGAGLTAVDELFVTKSPENFLFVQDITNGQDANGSPIKSKLFKVRKLQVGNRIFKNELVMAIDMTAIRKHISPDAQVIIGYNLISQANWFFDVQNKYWVAD
jgi:hypothetical protein